MSETTTRPTIDFSGDSRATARDYADSLISRVNKPATNEVLDAVRSGSEEVDAYALAEALLDAMRHVSTRFGQSMQRRKYGERAAHLGYIAHAVLKNHADGLPAYEKGERSRALEEVKTALAEAGKEVDALVKALDTRRREVVHQGEVNQRLAADLTAERLRVSDLRNERGLLTQAASDERRRLVEEIEALKAERDALATELSEAKQVIEGLSEDLTRHVALREYVEGYLLDAESLAAVAGFTHGWVSATRD